MEYLQQKKVLPIDSHESPSIEELEKRRFEVSIGHSEGRISTEVFAAELERIRELWLQLPADQLADANEENEKLSQKEDFSWLSDKIIL